MDITHMYQKQTETIGIVLLNYKTYAETIRLVLDLRKQRNISLQIVVVDNCSPNESLEQLRKSLGIFPEVTILASPENTGYAAGNNLDLNFLLLLRHDSLLL